MKNYTQKQNKNDLNLHFAFDFDEYMCEQLFDIAHLFDEYIHKSKTFIDDNIVDCDECDNDDTIYDIISFDISKKSLEIIASNNTCLYDNDDNEFYIDVKLIMNVKIIEHENDVIEIEYTNIKTSIELNDSLLK